MIRKKYLRIHNTAYSKGWSVSVAPPLTVAYTLHQIHFHSNDKFYPPSPLQLSSTDVWIKIALAIWRDYFLIIRHYQSWTIPLIRDQRYQTDLMPECRCRADSVDSRKKCRCRTDFSGFPAFIFEGMYASNTSSVEVGVYLLHLHPNTSRVWTSWCIYFHNQ